MHQPQWWSILGPARHDLSLLTSFFLRKPFNLEFGFSHSVGKCQPETNLLTLYFPNLVNFWLSILSLHLLFYAIILINDYNLQVAPKALVSIIHFFIDFLLFKYVIQNIILSIVIWLSKYIIYAWYVCVVIWIIPEHH